MQWAQALGDFLVAILSEKFHGLVDGHLKDVVDVLTLVAHFEHIFLEAHTVAGFASEHQIGHKLHLHLDSSLAFTFFTASAVGVEAEKRGREVHLLGQRLRSHQFADFVVGFNIGDGI